MRREGRAVTGEEICCESVCVRGWGVGGGGGGYMKGEARSNWSRSVKVVVVVVGGGGGEGGSKE